MPERTEMLERALKEAEEKCLEANLQKEKVENFNRLVSRLEVQKLAARNYTDIKEFLTEDMYHSLCETPLGTKSILGMVLGEMLGIPFKERKANCFLYALDNGWEVEIPSYSERCVKLIVGNNFLKQNVEDTLDFRLANDDRARIQKKIDKWNEYLNASDARKSELIYVGLKDYPVYRLARFKAANLAGKYDRRVKKDLAEFKECYEHSTELMQGICDGYTEKYEAQTEQLRKYASLLLGWTGTLLVYRTCDRGYPSLCSLTLHSVSDIPAEAIVPTLV